MIFSTTNGKQSFKRKTYNTLFEIYPIIRKQVESTDFTVEELAKIEYAFEKNTKIYYDIYKYFNQREIREDQIKGLSAVVKVMESFPTEKPYDRDYVREFKEKAELIPIE